MIRTNSKPCLNHLRKRFRAKFRIFYIADIFIIFGQKGCGVSQKDTGTPKKQPTGESQRITTLAIYYHFLFFRSNERNFRRIRSSELVRGRSLGHFLTVCWRFCVFLTHSATFVIENNENISDIKNRAFGLLDCAEDASHLVLSLS